MKIKFIGSGVDLNHQNNDYNIILKNGENEKILGTSNNDIIDGGGGLDSIFGGFGQDKVIFFASLEKYNFTIRKLIWLFYKI